MANFYLFFPIFSQKIDWIQKTQNFKIQLTISVLKYFSASRNRSFWENCKRSPIITFFLVFGKNLNLGLIGESNIYHTLFRSFWVEICQIFRFSLDILVLRRERKVRDHFCMFCSYESIFYLWTAAFCGTKLPRRVKKLLIFEEQLSKTYLLKYIEGI